MGKKDSGLVDPSGRKLSQLGDLPEDEQPYALEAIERIEDITIAKELAGVSEWANLLVYLIPFKTGKVDQRTKKPITKDVAGLTINGVREVGKKYHPAGFKLDPMTPNAPYFVDVDYDVTGEGKSRKKFAQAGVKLTSRKTGEESIATAMQEMMAKRGGKEGQPVFYVFDQHYNQKALTKAIRKGIEDQLQPTVRFKWMRTWLRERAKILRIDGESQKVQISHETKKTGASHWRARLFKICWDHGMKEDALTKVYLEHEWQKPFDKMTDADLREAGDQLETKAVKRGDEEFGRMIREMLP